MNEGEAYQFNDVFTLLNTETEFETDEKCAERQRPMQIFIGFYTHLIGICIRLGVGQCECIIRLATFCFKTNLKYLSLRILSKRTFRVQ